MQLTDANFPTHTYLRQRWNTVGRSLAFQSGTPEDDARWRTEMDRTLKRLTGYDTMEKCELAARITDETVFEDHVRQRVEIQTEPDVVMPIFVLIPLMGSGPYPVVIAPHGHGSGGKLSVAGCREYPEINEAIVRNNYDYGLQFVRAGFIVFCPDARGFGERREAMDAGDLMTSSCRWINNMAYPLGQTVTGMWTWDLHRLLDYVESRQDCRQNRIGCAGLSGGGLQTLWATALDPRIGCAVISGYMYGYLESLLDLYANCSCNYVPHLYQHVDMGDIAALIAPRPLLVESGSIDPLNGASGLENVESQLEIVRRAYAVHGAEEEMMHVVFAGEHQWGGAETIPWLQKQLMA